MVRLENIRSLCSKFSGDFSGWTSLSRGISSPRIDRLVFGSVETAEITRRCDGEVKYTRGLFFVARGMLLERKGESSGCRARDP